MTILEEAPAVSNFIASTTGTGRAYGSGGQLFSGVTTTGQRFAMPLSLQAVSTVTLRLKTSKEPSVRGLEGCPQAEMALQLALDSLDLGPVEVVAKTSSMINAAKDLGAWEADAAATIYALYKALERPVSPQVVMELIAEASARPVGLSGAPYRSMGILDVDTGKVITSAPTLPRLAYTIIRPIKPTGRNSLVKDARYDILLKEAKTLKGCTAQELGKLASRFSEVSAQVSEHALTEFLFEDLNPLFSSRGLALPVGVALNPLTNGAAVLFDDSSDGRRSASAASIFLRSSLPNHWFSISTTHGPVVEN